MGLPPTSTTRRTRVRLVALGVTVLAVLGGLGLRPADGTGGSAPALVADVPDPEVVIRGDRTLVFSTNSTTRRGPMHVPVRQWRAGKGWSLLGDALPQLPTWTRPGRVWAPGVLQLGPQRWALYFTSRHRETGVQCIGRALAPQARGPYRGDASPLICDAPEGGSIDASTFVDDDGSRWLLWKTDGNRVGRRSVLKSVRLDAAGRPSGPVSVLLRSGAWWEQGIIENPELVRGAAGLVLVYSGGRWNDHTYALGTAHCASPAGPCRRTSDGPVLATGRGLHGPGGAAVAIDRAGTLQLVFHGWVRRIGYGSGGVRALHTLPIDVHTGTIQVRPERAPVGRRDERPRVVLRRAPTPVPAGDHVARFGAAGGQFLACDFDGDGVDAVIWYDDGVWNRSDRAATDPGSRFRFGQRGDQALCGDLDGDGDDDAVVRRGTTFFLASTAQDRPSHIELGSQDQHGVVGDWDGDGDAELGLYDPTTGRFELRRGRDRSIAVRFGPRGGVPVVGDWNGDGATNVGVRAGEVFHLDLVGDGSAAVTIRLGTARSDPLAGRWSPESPAGDSIGTAR